MSDWALPLAPGRQLETYSTFRDMPAYNKGSPASSAYPVANLIHFYPILVPERIRVENFYVANGSVVGGSWRLGLYTPNGGLLTETALTTQTGGSIPQLVAPAGAPLVIAPGWYYLAHGHDNTTGRYNRSLGVTAEAMRLIGIRAQTADFSAGLPNPATFTAPTSAYIAWVGFTARTSMP